ncbi:SDR family NAD(P)-dependent oxidoreductase [Aliikangiella sp. IMCC44359]|uniref:SDR family NAD(P)-dependent oxidoreductase n=1 Tax=Aliikangiella sp. IMCC44359 TaxID=3459125 RepID=UPI00403AB0CE
MNNKTIIISGGSTGLGLEMSQCLLKEGYNIRTFSRNPSDGTQTLESVYADSNQYSWCSLDSTNYEGLKNFVNQIEENNEQIVGLVNNAGINLDRLLATTSDDELHKVVAVNLESLMALTRIVTRVMLQTGNASIINISSVIGHRGIKGTSVYSATKAGVVGFTKSLARELGVRNIRVNALLPGYIETDMTHNMAESKKAQIIRRTPLTRMGKASDIASVAKFLLSAESSFITGQEIVVDGGLTC